MHSLQLGLSSFFLLLARVTSGKLLSRNRPAVSLLFVTLLLFSACCLMQTGFTSAALTLIVIAIGSENTVFQSNGEVVIGLTYVTGTLVTLGQRLAAAPRGESAMDWIPYALLWLGPATGAAFGAIAYKLVGLQSVWLATATAAALTVCAWLGQLA